MNIAKLNLNKALQETDEARALAEQANATKSAFLANMSHEIRTPLGAILGFNSLLKDSALSSDERNLFIDTIDRNGKALTRIIDDILDLAKVEAGKLEIEYNEFSLFELMHDTVDLFREIAAQKHIRISLTYDRAIPRSILFDSTRLRQVFINIVGNAVKFTSKGEVQITVTAAADESAADTYKFLVNVKDSGPGLSSEQKERLFQPFMQGDNSVTRKFGGTGLGLVLSKRLIEALSGGIELTQHTLGEGCTFSINFPAKNASQDKTQLTPISETQSFRLLKSRLDKIKLLLVDDSLDNLLLVKRLLVRSGASVETANDGLEAVEKVLAGDYHLVLMDIQMPRMDGFEAIRTLRSKGCDIPVLALTAHAMLEEKQKSLAAGFSGHLTKPLNFAEMVQMIRRYALH
ncbi:MAG: response regulator [Chitinophagaceae bacterium]|nr:response regulator [Oligoflexus sp.]